MINLIEDDVETQPLYAYDYEAWARDGMPHVTRLPPLPTITYKPGWEFEWSGRNGMVFLDIVVRPPSDKAIDSRTGEVRMHDYYGTPVPGVYLGSKIVPMPFSEEWLRWYILKIERHETDEWLKFNGVQFFHPHD